MAMSTKKKIVVALALTATAAAAAYGAKKAHEKGYDKKALVTIKKGLKKDLAKVHAAEKILMSKLKGGTIKKATKRKKTAKKRSVKKKN